MRAEGNVLFQGTRLFICNNTTTGPSSGVMRMFDVAPDSFITASVLLDNSSLGATGGHLVSRLIPTTTPTLIQQGDLSCETPLLLWRAPGERVLLPAAGHA